MQRAASRHFSMVRDFHLADLFFEAGREAAEEQLPKLQSLARPTKEVAHGRS